MRGFSLFAAVLALVCVPAFGAEKYTGPRPPKADVPYLLHADNLIETEVGQANQENGKNQSVAAIPGANSSVRTPLSEPVFIMRTDKLSADRMECYKLESRNGRREVVIGQKKGKGVSRPIYLAVTRLEDRLYKIEVDEPLENGEYSLTPQGSDQTFSFAIY